jgi:hypothetical protein
MPDVAKLRIAETVAALSNQIRALGLSLAQRFDQLDKRLAHLEARVDRVVERLEPPDGPRDK